jgi:hypothetical protein
MKSATSLALWVCPTVAATTSNNPNKNGKRISVHLFFYISFLGTSLLVLFTLARRGKAELYPSGL